jgi:pimeloyl-ACP methyl ester carboxylesterase
MQNKKGDRSTVETFRRGDREISYKSLGTSGKPSLLMLCGLGMPMSSWGLTPKRFARDFFVVTWDYPGLGKSSKLEGSFSTLDLAYEAAALLDHLGIQHTHVLGYSMGGIVAQELAIAHRGLVKRVAFLASTPISDSISWINPVAQAAMVKAANDDPSKLIQELIRYAFNKPANRRLYGSLSRLYSATSDPDTLKKMFNASYGRETWSRLHTLSAEKALALNGSEDHIINSDAGAALAQRIPNCTADLIIGGSHSLLQEFREETEDKLYAFFIS